MKKVFGQTARNLKREVNKKVLKVSGIEQKILDATSNEPWGPHGTHLAEIAQATRNSQDYQVIMSIIWKRINDTGKNWRHVFKALTVLEYLVAHGSERVIDEIRDHGYQISILAEFRYVDSSGKDQGINVRKKSQILVALVNDKELIQEVRKKAQTNRDMYDASSMGGTYRQSPGGYNDRHDDDRYGNRSDEGNGYRDDSTYSRGRNSHEQYDRDVNRDDNYRNHSSEENQVRSRSRSVDEHADNSFGDDSYSSRNGGSKADDQFQDERGPEPPSYQQATRKFRDMIQDERTEEAKAGSRENLSSPVVPAHSPEPNNTQSEERAGESVASQNNMFDTVDEFDPRGSASAVQPVASSQELDIFGFSAVNSADPSTVMPESHVASQSDTSANSVFGADFFTAPSSASSTPIQAFEDPFGDGPFKAVAEQNVQAESQQNVTSFQHPGSMGSSETFPTGSQKAETFSGFGFGDALGGFSFAPNGGGQHASVAPLTTELPTEQSTDDILDSILPRNGSTPMFPSQEAQTFGPANGHTTETNPFQPSEFAPSAVIPGPQTFLQTDQMNPFQLSGALAPVAAQGSSMPTGTDEINPFQPFGGSASAAPQETTSSTLNPFPPSGLPPVSASRELQINVHTAQMNSPQQLALPSPAASEGTPTNMQSSQMNSPQQRALPSPAASEGTPANKQSSQMNFFQPSGPSATVSLEQANSMQTVQMNFSQPPISSVPAAPELQTAQMNFFQPPSSSVPAPPEVRASQMNFFQPPAQSAPVAPQGSQMNIPTYQMNYFQPSAVSTPGASQTFHPQLPTAQMNFQQQPPRMPTPAGFQGPQTHPQMAQPSYFMPSGLQAPAGLQGAQTHNQMGQPSFLAPPHLQSPSFPQGLQSNVPTPQSNFFQQSAPPSSQAAQSAAPSNMQIAQPGPPTNLVASQAAPLSSIPTTRPQPPNAKFETKSTVWADTLSRGLVNLDISGPKTNPLADIGVDFDAINRREKRLEPKSSAPPVTSTIVMGKAMGSGSGMGRSGAAALAAPNSMMGGGGGMGMRGGGMGMGGGVGMGMGGGYGGGMNQPGMNMGMGMGMGVGMNMGMGQGAPMQPPGPGGMPSGGYNPMMGMGGYGPQYPQQPPYGGGGYR